MHLHIYAKLNNVRLCLVRVVVSRVRGCFRCTVSGGGGFREKIRRIRETRMREMKRVYEARAENIAKGHGQVRLLVRVHVRVSVGAFCVRRVREV